MVTVFNNKHLGWIGTTSLNHYELIVDDVANLPNDEYYFGPEHKMAQGSIAWVIASAKFYMFDSNGDWILQVNSGGGTGDYTDLSNKPQINGVTLVGDKSSSDLHLQAIIDAAHKLSADNVDDTNATNKFATAAQLSQIETNKNNISSLQTSLAVGSSDNAKVLTAIYEGGTGSYSWVTPTALKSYTVSKPSDGSVNTATFDWSQLAKGTYLITCRNYLSPTNRCGISIYVFEKIDDDSLELWTPISDITNAKISSYVVSSNTLTLTYDVQGYHNVKIVDFNI